jgi:hypothetical protein
MLATTTGTGKRTMSGKTTDPPKARKEPWIQWSAREWKLVLTTIVSAAYTAAWVAFAAGTPGAADRTPVTPPSAAPRGPSVWLHDIPASKRPRVFLPSGWRVAERATEPRPVLVRRPAADVRIRTRSS